MPNPKLYRTLEETPRYGKLLAKDSSGNSILDLPGGAVAFPSSQIEEVVPYTVQLENHTHVVVPKDSLTVGDVIVMDGNLLRVCKLDTKQTQAIETAKIRRVVTEALQ